MTPPEQSRRDLEHVGDLVDGVESSLGGRAGLSEAALLWAEWDDLAGPAWAGTEPLKLDRGVLSVAVPNGIAATRLRYEVGDLLRRVSDRLGSGVVVSVALRVRHRRGRREEA
jgi:hypothetical protein